MTTRSGSDHDVAVLGAGIVGISTAIHLAKRGADVILIDRRAPGEETSFGNAGIIQREGIHPYLFPRDPVRLLQYALNLLPDAHYQFSSIFSVSPFLFRYWRASTPEMGRKTMQANIPLFAACLEAHQELAREARAEQLIARKGWIRLFRSRFAARAMETQITDLKGLGLDAVTLAAAELETLEPHLDGSRLASAVHYRDPWAVSDPGALAKAYAELFETLGGTITRFEAKELRQERGNWTVNGGDEALSAEQVVLALGPWSKHFLDGLGMKLPMGIKRGYHQHFRPNANKHLSRPIVDDEMGFVLAPMSHGIRLSTGAEFARIDAPRTPVQIKRCLPLARDWFDLGDAVDAEPWMGARPVFPDMLPVMGPAPGYKGLWLNFGHAHHGFTLAPVAGKLLAQMVTGEQPFCDPSPYAASRFLQS